MNVGCHEVDVTDSLQGVRVPLRLFYPTTAPSRPERLGSHTVDVATNAPVDGQNLCCRGRLGHGLFARDARRNAESEAGRFDRAAYQPVLAREIAAFLRRALSP